MLAVDTNVVVRYLVGDDPEQSDKARRLFQDTAVWISATVLLEAAWVLRKTYRYRPDQIAWSFRLMAGRSTVTLQNPAALFRAFTWMRRMDFADALHLAQSEDLDALVTFDRDFVLAAADVESTPVRLL
ncbi:MAG: type II toxin-antitoxin system VapC family toxin [Caulobacter sp.]|nr:type II toxin-antitoxin system VapC family toxin [Caulobacter sp.]